MLSREGKQTDRGAVGAEFIGYNRRRRETLLLQEFPHQPNCRPSVPAGLNQEIQDFALTVHGTPEIELPPSNYDDHLVQVPAFGRSWPPTLNPPRIGPTEFQDPSSNCLIRDVETTLGKQVLNVPIAQRETAIEPDGMLDDDRWKAVTTVGYLAHPETLKHRPCRSHAVNVTMPARELKLLRVGLVSVDGSKFKANASKHRSVTYERAGGLIGQLEGEIAALLRRAEAADVAGEEDPQALPQEIARREALRDKLDAARRHLEAQAEARAAAEREAFEAKVAAREKRRGRAKGKHPKPPAETPAADAQSNLSDPDSRLMRKSKQHEYRQAYNAQAAVDAGGSQLIVSARIGQCASDRNELVADIAAIPAVLGRPETVLADNGYANGAEVAALEASGIEVLVSTAAEGRRRTHDFRPAKAPPAVKQPKADWLKAMAEKLASEEGRALYKLRRQTVEPVFGVIKAVLGFAGFSLRGLDKVEGEWTLVALAYNCKRLHKLSLAT